MVSKNKLSEVVLLTKSYNLQDFKDWLHWHLDIIGFDCCHIFDNESWVDIKSICDSYGDRVTYELITGWPNQYTLYNKYINNKSSAWWVLPIDDDEFLYIGDKFHNNVNEMILTLQDKWPDIKKFSIGWRNMFPLEYTEKRTKSLIENATGWSDFVCKQLYPIWRQDNRWVKTFVKTTATWYWGMPHNGGHNPTYNCTNNNVGSYLINGKKIYDDWINPPCACDDLFIAHFQYKSNIEWIMKCRERKSAANKTFNKNKPKIYKTIYKYSRFFKTFDGLLKLWK